MKKTIHIKSSHEGEFTAKAKAHGMSVPAFANHVLGSAHGKFDAATHLQANFARNARKFKH